MNSPQTLSFGCRLNTAETAAMARLAAAGGCGADALVMNTCAVTTEAEAQARQALRRAARENPALRIVVTGCAATIRPEAWARLPNVVRVLPNADKLRPEAWGAPAEAAWEMAAEAGARTRALVQVQQGCDHHCTFCIIPQGRGASRSLPAERVVARIAALVAEGVAEVVLTGVDIASWTGPAEARLGDLVAAVLAGVPELARLRLSSLDPAAMDATLWRLLAEQPRLLPHLHLSAQHGDDLMLKRMRRRHSRADLLALAARARALRPDVVLGADLIAGFPTEDEAAFAALQDLVAEAGLSFLHVFPYSPRPGTPAARMPQVPHAVIRERAARLRAAGQRAAERFLASRVGAREKVLLEAEDRGHSEHFAVVQLHRPVAGGRGRVVEARVTGVGPRGLLAEAA